jgi:hypothetical protein
VLNYCTYQDNENKKEQQSNNKVTTKEQQSNTDKNLRTKEVKKKDIYISAQHLSLTKVEYEKLVIKYGESAVDSKIEYAQNYAKLKNYVSLYKTLDNWLKKDGQQPKGKKSSPLDYLDDIDLGD